MATAAPAAPPQGSRSFAGLLEEYAAPEKKFPPSRDLDLLEDDVATLTYEHALRTHARYRPEPVPDKPQNAAARITPQLPPISHEERQALPHTFGSVQPATAVRMSASITVRLTAEENDRLRTRATEAGLTISAYLRSCTFEVESLRSQVKEAVARMRAAEECKPQPRPSWFRRMFLRWRRRD